MKSFYFYFILIQKNLVSKNSQVYSIQIIKVCFTKIKYLNLPISH